MNARFIQGIFDDKADPARFARFGHDVYDPAANTARLVAALPQWYDHGLRAFTVGLQGGGPCFTINNRTIDNNPFGEDGTQFDPAYADRLDTLIRGADAAGMVVIVSYFYGDQTRRLRTGARCATPSRPRRGSSRRAAIPTSSSRWRTSSTSGRSATTIR